MTSFLNNSVLIYALIAICVVFNFVSLPDGVSGLMKKLLGVLSIILALYATYGFISEGIKRMGAANATPIIDTQWIILIVIFTPVMIGLAIHGYYGVKGEYDQI